MLKGGTFHISENSILKLLNSTIFNGFGSLFYLLENYFGYIYIENSIFRSNHGNQTLFDAIQTQVIIKNCSFANNTNTLFYLVDSQIRIDNIKIVSHFCYNDQPGCVLSAINASTFINSIELIDINHYGEEGNLYFQNSQILINSLKIENVKTREIKGSCLSLYNSTLNISESQIFNYQINCIFGSESNVMIENAYFDNSESTENVMLFDYGSFYCQDCAKIVINNSKFIKNSFAIDGTAIFIKNTRETYYQKAEIINNNFIENFALGRGIIFVDSSDIQIISNIFFGNTAKIGGAIFIINELSNVIHYFDYLIKVQRIFKKSKNHFKRFYK